MSTHPRDGAQGAMPIPLMSLAGPSWRAVGLVLAGILLGVLVTSASLARVTALSVTPAATLRWGAARG
jgi:hypothetical protein